MEMDSTIDRQREEEQVTFERLLREKVFNPEFPERTEILENNWVFDIRNFPEFAMPL